MVLLDYLHSIGIDCASSGEVTLPDGGSALLLVNPTKVECGIAEQGKEYFIILHTHTGESHLFIDVAAGAEVRILHVMLDEAKCSVKMRQQADSRCEMTSVIVAGSSLDYVADMNGRFASNVLRVAYVIGGQERASVNVRVNHNAEDCKSNSLVKGVAGGSAVGEFEGMVYVAPDAQRTDAVQTSRNIEIGREAHIVAKPQLEIYADDVKCSHGATVGQLDGEAVLYMRQRGLSLEQAKRLQIEGFVGDVVSQAGIFSEVLSQELASKLELL
jgi:Fe-S cluster assembly protein SufD